MNHALLSLTPLEYPLRGLSARLACLIHAANVHSEPGSNPSLICAQSGIQHRSGPKPTTNAGPGFSSQNSQKSLSRQTTSSKIVTDPRSPAIRRHIQTVLCWLLKKTGSNYQIVKEQVPCGLRLLRAVPHWDSSFYRRVEPRQAVQKEFSRTPPERLGWHHRAAFPERWHNS